MATIEKRTSSNGTISYRVKVRLKGYAEESASFQRLTDAKRWSSQMESAIREGRHFVSSEAKKHTLSDAIERYQNECLSDLKDPFHRTHHLRWWSNRIGHLILSDLRPSAIVECRDYLKNAVASHGRHKDKPRSKATVNRYLASLSPVLSEAVKEWGWMESNPCLKVKRYKESDGRTRFLSTSEREALLKACDELEELPETQVIILIAITTGMRRGEIMNLRWKHVDLNRQRFTIEKTKTGETRSVPIVGPALSALEGWSKVRPINDDILVFPGHSERTKDKPLDFDKAWQEILTRADIQDFRFHDLRHTAASYLAMNGAGLREIGDILGHKTLTMVQRYSHLTDDHKQKTMERMSSAIFGEKL